MHFFYLHQDDKALQNDFFGSRIFLLSQVNFFVSVVTGNIILLYLCKTSSDKLTKYYLLIEKNVKNSIL